MNIRLRMYKDYFVYLASLQKKETFVLLVDLFSFLFSSYATVMQLTDEFQWTKFSFSVLMIFLLSSVKLCWDTYKIATDIIKYKQSDKFEIQVKENIVLHDTVFPLDELLPSQPEERISFKKITMDHRNDFVFTSPEVNRHLRNTPLTLEEDKRKGKKIKKVIMNDKDLLIPFLNYQFSYSLFEKKHFYNEKKLCMSEDIDITNNRIFCHKGSYFDTYLTNHVCTRQLLSKDTNRVIYDGTGYFPVEYVQGKNEIRLPEIGFSEMNNEIGVSTLGFTSDNYLVIWEQNAFAQSSNHLFVPTGSGSSDWKDIVEQDFTKTITNGMERELWEESGKKSLGTSSDQIGSTKVIGFFRWVKRGGKPEFTGITKLNARSSQLDPELQEVRKSKSRHMWKIESEERLKEVIQEIKAHKDTSIPLYMCLLSLEQFLEENMEECKSFLSII